MATPRMPRTQPRVSAQAQAAIDTLTAAGVSPEVAKVVSGNSALVGSAAVYKPGARLTNEDDRQSIAQPWQVEAYRHVKICGEARYAAALFSAMAGRAEIGVSQPQVLRDKPSWVLKGAEVEAFAEIAPTVRERTKMIRDYMLHRTIAGESYLIARERRKTDFGYIDPPKNPTTGAPYLDWDEWTREHVESIDVLDPDYDPQAETGNPNFDNPIWEIVGVTELRRTGDLWSVRHDNDTWLDLRSGDPVIRMWTPDPEKRREAWSPFQSLLPTLREIEWLTMHIFTQVRSRLMSSGTWFLPNNLTFPAPPMGNVPGGAEAYAAMNDAEQFMTSLAASSMSLLDPEDVAFPTVIMADPAALDMVSQDKLIQFWSEIDDKAMILRNAALHRFAEGMDMPTDRITQAVSNSGGGSGSAGGASTNHWGEWAKEEQAISDHVEPALDDFVGILTDILRSAVDGTSLVIAYGTASLRLRQDRSKEAVEWYDRGVMKATVALTHGGFDPENDIMDEAEHRMWIINKIVSNSQYDPSQLTVLAAILGVDLPEVSGNQPAKQIAGRDLPPSLDDHPYEGPPRVDHEHNDAPYKVLLASCEGLALRALEKYGNTVLNDGKRGRDKDRSTPPVEAQLTASLGRTVLPGEFDFSTAHMALSQLSPADRAPYLKVLGDYCANLYNEGKAYRRTDLRDAMKGLS